MRKSQLQRYLKIYRKFDAMPKDEIASRLRFVQDRALTYHKLHEAILKVTRDTGLPYGKVADLMAKNHGFSHFVTFKCLLLMKDKYHLA